MVDFNWIICFVFWSIINQQTCNGFFIYKYPNHELAECGKSKVTEKTRIINGEEAEPGRYPWMISLENELLGGWAGAILIYDQWVLSAAHCFKNAEPEANDPTHVNLRVGSRDNENGTIYKIEKIFVHPAWGDDGEPHYQYDIALLKTTEPIGMTKGSAPEPVNIICLPDDHAEPRSNQLVATGWGLLSYDPSTGEATTSRLFQTVTLDVISDEQCQAMQDQARADNQTDKNYQILPSQICTWTRNKSTCSGDSGGPLIEYVDGHAVLIGIKSYSVLCAKDYPTVFTQVSHFIDWMAETIMNNL